MPRTSRDKFFGAINESYDAVLSAIEGGNARAYRASRTALKEARKGERELVGLARKWADSPTSFFDLFEAAVDVQARGQMRALELTRDIIGGARESGREVREASRGVIQGNRAAGEAVVDGLRGAYERTLERFRAPEEEEAPVSTRPTPIRASRPAKAPGRKVARAARRAPVTPAPPSASVPPASEAAPAVAP